MLSGCNPVNVSHDWDTNRDFSLYRTFYILADDKQAISLLTNRDIETAISDVLSEKGLLPSSNFEQADLTIGFQLTSRERTSYTTAHQKWGVHRRSRYPGRISFGYHRAEPLSYTVSTLVIAVFQSTDMALIWEGTGSSTLRQSPDTKPDNRRINTAVAKILAPFPPAKQ